MRSESQIKPRGIKHSKISELQKFAKAFMKIGEVQLGSKKHRIKG